VPDRVEAKICRRRRTEKVGPDRLAIHLDLPPSTIYRVLRRHDLHRLGHIDRQTAQPIRRYERTRPGELVHVDVKKLGRIPAGGGHKVHGRQARPSKKRWAGYAYLHTAIDDYSRLAYTEILTDEKGATAAAFWRRADAWFRARGVVVERVLTDNHFSYRGILFNQALAETQIIHKYCRPYRPQTNGKVERFHRTLLEEWAYARPYCREADRTRAFAHWLHRYNHHRVHTAVGGPPVSRVTNLPREHT
jgi:transposase InsO family protein